MTSDDKEFLKEFIRGVFVTIGVFVFGLLFIAFISTPDSTKNGVESLKLGVEPLKFGVVDQYKNCDVVRYTDPSQRYRYFLHCPKAP